MSRKAGLKNIINLKKRLVVGLNSGTSADGVDAVIVRITGNGLNSRVKFICGKTYRFKPALKLKIKKYSDLAFHNADKWLELDVELAQYFTNSTLRLIKTAGLRVDDINLIGSHGQTIRHRPGTKWGTITCQLADPARIAVGTGILTVGDFRAADVSAGGEGAPLTPVVNAILFKRRNSKIGVLNLGGIANITSISYNNKKIKIFGCDTGPGNMLVDYLASKLFSREYDKNGNYASQGRAYYPVINRVLSRKFFSIKGPKSTGREMFGKEFGDKFLLLCRKYKLTKYDIMATASMLTTEAVSRCCQINNLRFDILIVSGGGIKNKFLCKSLIRLFPSTTVSGSGDYGFPEDYLEAVSFAVLANEAICSNSYDLVNVTRSRKPVICGKICQG